MHHHACHHCGALWAHNANDAASRAEFIAAHTCPSGHICTVKFDKPIAERIAAECKAGNDPLPYIATADPLGYRLLMRSNR